MEWHKLGGYDWCILDKTPGAGPFIGLTMGYGLVHEPITAFGTLQFLAGMLQAELSRPIETAPGQVAVPEVSVQVGSDTTDIGIRGDHATVLSAWKCLAEIFAGGPPARSGPAGGRAHQCRASRSDESFRYDVVDAWCSDCLGCAGLA